MTAFTSIIAIAIAIAAGGWLLLASSRAIRRVGIRCFTVAVLRLIGELTLIALRILLTPKSTPNTYALFNDGVEARPPLTNPQNPYFEYDDQEKALHPINDRFY